MVVCRWYEYQECSSREEEEREKKGEVVEGEVKGEKKMRRKRRGGQGEGRKKRKEKLEGKGFKGKGGEEGRMEKSKRREKKETEKEKEKKEVGGKKEGEILHWEDKGIRKSYSDSSRRSQTTVDLMEPIQPCMISGVLLGVLCGGSEARTKHNPKVYSRFTSDSLQVVLCLVAF